MMMKNKLSIAILVFVAVFSLSWPAFSEAKTVLYQTQFRDGDYDGLTDQGEEQIYKTDFQNADTDGDGYLDGAEVISGTDPLTNASAPVTANTRSASIWPWYVTRASGLVSYIFLFLLIISGIGIKTSLLFRFISPSVAWLNHRYIGIILTISIGVHLASLLLDQYLKFTPLDVFIPFSSGFKPLFLSLGIIGFYVFLLIMTSSIFYINRFPRIWRLLHYLTYPLFVILFIHGYFIGTDTSSALVQAIYLSTGVIAALMGAYRLRFYLKQR